LDYTQLNEDGDFEPELGDQLQIKLKIDGQEVLIETKNNLFETSVIIPERALGMESFE
tara:strand:- start:6006 stop:6179 length:174 start_codon:yes stop_codon:yes gene_type:complete